MTNGKCENITVPTGCASLKIRILPKTSEIALYGEIVVKKIQLEEGAECTAFEVKNGVLIQNDYKPVSLIYFKCKNIQENNNQISCFSAPFFVLHLFIRWF